MTWDHTRRQANLLVGDELPRKEVIQPQLPLRLPCSRWSLCRHKAWTISSSCCLAAHPGGKPPSPLRLRSGVRRVVSEGSKYALTARLLDFPADCPHQTDCHTPCLYYATRAIQTYHVLLDTRVFQHTAKFLTYVYTQGSQQNYDFVPVTSPTLGRCPPCGLAYGLQVLPAPMT